MRSRRWTSFWIGVAGLVILFYLPDWMSSLGFIETGRAKLTLAAVGTAVLAGGGAWWTYGPTLWEVPSCFCFVSSGADPGDTDVDTEARSGAASDDNGSTGSPVREQQDDALESLRRENAELRRSNTMLSSPRGKLPVGVPLPPTDESMGQVSPNMEALRAFALEQSPTGPISQAAAQFALPPGILSS